MNPGHAYNHLCTCPDCNPNELPMSDLNDAQGANCVRTNNPNLKEFDPEERHVFASGAKRSTVKPAYHLFSKIAMERLAKTLDYGASKYGDYNWEKGLPVADCLNHAYEHILEFLAGDRRTEPEIDHLGHAFCNLMFAIHMMETQPEKQTDLRPDLGGAKPVPPLCRNNSYEPLQLPIR